MYKFIRFAAVLGIWKLPAPLKFNSWHFGLLAVEQSTQESLELMELEDMIVSRGIVKDVEETLPPRN